MNFEDFIFQEGRPGEVEAVFDFEPTLFHNPLHLQLQQADGWRWYFAVYVPGNIVVASLYLHISNDVATGSVRSPFGTVECSERISVEGLYRFIGFVEGKLRTEGITKIRLKNPSFLPYMPHGSLLHTLLFHGAYQVVDVRPGTVRLINDDFSEPLNSLEKRRQKASAKGFVCRVVEASQFETVYTFIATHHQRKGYSLSMTWDELSQTMAVFPDRYLAFGVYTPEGSLAAASVAIKVSSRVLYYFYADHDEAYDEISPVVLLVEGLYDYARVNEMTVLDLGTSAAADGRPNFGLLAFKMRLGGVPMPQLTFEKNLVP